MILHELLSYDVLRVIWWLLLGILLVGFAVTDGFDLGAAALLRATGKTDVERRVVINTIGPVWEGNQVWLILGGGAIFAAWPQLYAIPFSWPARKLRLFGLAGHLAMQEIEQAEDKEFLDLVDNLTTDHKE